MPICLHIFYIRAHNWKKGFIFINLLFLQIIVVIAFVNFVLWLFLMNLVNFAVTLFDGDVGKNRPEIVKRNLQLSAYWHCNSSTASAPDSFDNIPTRTITGVSVSDSCALCRVPCSHLSSDNVEHVACSCFCGNADGERCRLHLLHVVSIVRIVSVVVDVNPGPEFRWIVSTLISVSVKTPKRPVSCPKRPKLVG